MIIAIAAGSVSGGVVILLIIATLVIILSTASIMCFKRKQKTLNMTNNVAYIGNSTANHIELTKSYAEEKYVYESMSMPFATVERNSIEEQRTSEDSLPCEVVNNVAYEQSPVSLSTNAAYKSHQGNETLDEYDYIHVVA